MFNIIKHRTRHHEALKFLALLALLVCYFGYLSWKYDVGTGGLVSALTWSFFVLCTPVADAGFLLDFPVRLISGVRMFITEIAVWGLALTISIASVLWDPQVFQTTFLTAIFYKILTTPWPLWSIIALCALGTFLSIYFGDQLMDNFSATGDKTKRLPYKTRLIAMGSVIVLIVGLYYALLDQLGIILPAS